VTVDTHYSTLISSVLTLLILISTPAFARDLPETTEDGLQRVPDSKMAVVYAEPGADLAGYQRIQLLDAYVAFKKNWAREQNRMSAQAMRVTSGDMEKIKKNLAEDFRILFTDVLESGGYTLTGETADDVLLVRPAIINLDVAAPGGQLDAQQLLHLGQLGDQQGGGRPNPEGLGHPAQGCPGRGPADVG
jgi:hypothetical protein